MLWHFFLPLCATFKSVLTYVLMCVSVLFLCLRADMANANKACHVHALVYLILSVAQVSVIKVLVWPFI